MLRVITTITILLAVSLNSFAQTDRLVRDDISIVNEVNINSEKLEYSPAFYEDGLVFITTKAPEAQFNIKDTRIGKNIMAIYLSRRNVDGVLDDPKVFAKELTTKFHEGPLVFDRLGEIIYFTRNNVQNGKIKKASDGEVKLQIFSAENDGGKWRNDVELNFNDDDSNYAHPSISVDGRRMYFSSDRPGGLGGTDIYYVDKQGEGWGDPVNLGPTVNTEGNELFPHIHADGMLYFASNAHNTIGGLDMFSSQYINGEWTPVASLGEPLNSAHDDFGLIVDRDKKNGYFSSDRPGGAGGDDIYSFHCSSPNGLDEGMECDKDIEFIVMDSDTELPLSNVQVNPINLTKLNMDRMIRDANGNLIMLENIDETDKATILNLEPDQEVLPKITNEAGSAPMELNCLDNYIMKFFKAGYIPKEVALGTEQESGQVFVFMDKAVETANINGRVLVEGTDIPIGGATVRMIAADGSVYEATTDENGYYAFSVPKDQTYDVEIYKDGKLISEQTLSTFNMESTDATVNMFVDPNAAGIRVTPVLEEGTVIELSNIYYNFNDAGIRPDARKDLDVLVDLMNRYPEMEIELLSHTDSRGSTRYNKRLSQRRAERVVQYLVSRGVQKIRMVPIGYGEDKLRNHCSDGVSCSEEEHQYNRRTEFRVISVDPGISVKYVDRGPETIDRYTGSSSSGSGYSSSGGSSSSGEYCVIAGTFRNRQNADRRLNQVISLGYSSAVLVTTGPYQAVCVQTFTSRSSARDLEGVLENTHGINAYVKGM